MSRFTGGWYEDNNPGLIIYINVYVQVTSSITLEKNTIKIFFREYKYKITFLIMYYDITRVCKTPMQQYRVFQWLDL